MLGLGEETLAEVGDLTKQTEQKNQERKAGVWRHPWAPRPCLAPSLLSSASGWCIVTEASSNPKLPA